MLTNIGQALRHIGTDLRVLDGGDGPGGEHQLLPGLLQVDDVDAVGLLLEDVLLHRGLAVVGADVRGGGEHLSDVILLQGGVGANGKKKPELFIFLNVFNAASVKSLASYVDQTAFPNVDNHITFRAKVATFHTTFYGKKVGRGF